MSANEKKYDIEKIRAGPQGAEGIHLRAEAGGQGLQRPHPVHQPRHPGDQGEAGPGRDEEKIHRRQGLRPQAAVGRGQRRTRAGTRPRTRSASPPAPSPATPTTRDRASRSSPPSRPRPASPSTATSAATSAPTLKFSGFDAMEIQGKSDRDVIIFIDGNLGKIQIMEAPLEAVDSHVVAEQLHELFAANEREKQHVSVVSAGRGAEHAWIGCLNFSYWDKRRKLPRLKQAGPRRHGHRLPQQEDQGAGGQVFRADRQIQQPGRHGDPAEDRAEAPQGDHRPSTTSSARCAPSAPPTWSRS